MALATVVDREVESSDEAPPGWASLLVALQVVSAELDFQDIDVPRAPIVAVLHWAPIVLLALRSELLLGLIARRPLRAFAVMVAWGVATVAWSVVPRSSLTTSLTMVGLSATAIWYVGSFGIARYWRAVVAGAVVFLSAGFVRDLVTVVQSRTVHRFDGYALHATDLARLALVIAVIAAIQLAERATRTPLMWAGLVVGIATLVTTGTRTTMFAFALCIFVLSFRRLGAGRTLLIGTALAIGLLVAVNSVPDPSKFVARDAEGRDITSVNGRLTIWSVSLDLTERSPVVGHGVSSGELLFPQASYAGELPVMIINHAHDMWLEITVGQGLVGLALTLIALGSFLATRPSATARLSGIVLLAVLVAGITEGVLGRPTGLYSVLAALYTERALASDGELS